MLPGPSVETRPPPPVPPFLPTQIPRTMPEVTSQAGSCMMHMSAKAGRGEAKTNSVSSSTVGEPFNNIHEHFMATTTSTPSAVTTLVSVGILLISLQQETWHKWVSAD